MAIKLGSNIDSLRTQRDVSSASGVLEQSYTRLSSGLRINTAADDAAGLAISETLKSNSRVYTQAVRNLNDGVSVLNVAEGALQSLQNITVRHVELAEQAANGVFSTSQRRALNAEADALTEEYNRIVESTKFNNQTLFDASNSSLVLQIGYGSDGTVTAQVNSTINHAQGTGTFSSTVTTITSGVSGGQTAQGDFNGDGRQDLLVFNGSTSYSNVLTNNGDGTFTAGASFVLTISNTSLAIGDFNGDGKDDVIADFGGPAQIFLGTSSGLQATGTALSGVSNNSRNLQAGDFNGDGKLDFIGSGAGASQLSVYLNNGNGTFSRSISYAVIPATNLSGQQKIADINNDGNQDLVYLTPGGRLFSRLGNGNGTFQSIVTITTSAATGLDVTDINRDGYVDIVQDDGIRFGNGDGTFRSFAASFAGYLSGTADLNGDGYTDVIAGDNSTGDFLAYLNDGSGSFSLSYSATLPSGSINTTISLVDSDQDGVKEIYNRGTGFEKISPIVRTTATTAHLNLTTAVEARTSLTTAKARLTEISNQIGVIGASQSRLDSARGVLESLRENFQRANDRIVSVDVAEESANMIRAQILQEVSSKVLQQVNLQPQLVLKLLSN